MSKKQLPIFSIVGTTSVGKSEAVFTLAYTALTQGATSKVIILSADSRQVYRGLEVLTGADVPEGFQSNERSAAGQYFSQHTPQGIIELHGIGLLSPTEEWSVGRFTSYAAQLVEQAQRTEALVLVVGGTGLYHQHLLTRDPHLFVPPNLPLRAELANYSVAELQEKLRGMDATKLNSLNHSDLHNPRRLLRAIEIALADQELQHTFVSTAAQPATKISANVQTSSAQPEHRYFGLQLPTAILTQRIHDRVQHRFAAGAVTEVEQLLASPVPVSSQAMTTLGFAQIAAYLAGEVSATECQSVWEQADVQYSKRQLTWWKKYGAVEWFDKTTDNWEEQLLAAFSAALTA